MRNSVGINEEVDEHVEKETKERKSYIEGSATKDEAKDKISNISKMIDDDDNGIHHNKDKVEDRINEA